MASDGSIGIRLRPATAKIVEERLKKLLAKVTDLKPLNAELAKYMVADTRRRFSTKIGPDGQPWAPLSAATEALKARADMVERLNAKVSSATMDRYLKMRFLPGDALVATGALKRSIQVGYVGAREFEIRATAPYAAVQQEGFDGITGFPGFAGKSIPARPFMGFSEANKRTINRKILEYLQSRE